MRTYSLFSRFHQEVFLQGCLEVFLMGKTTRTGTCDNSQKALLALLNYVDNANLFLLELSLAVIRQLENEPFVAKFQQVCAKEFANYLGEINPKNVTRYMNLAKIVHFLAIETGFAPEFKGFNYWRKKLLDLRLATRQVEQGGGWAGFGGVHSHYTFTDIGMAFYNLQTCLLVKPSISQDLFKQSSTLDTSGLVNLATETILFKRKQVNADTPFSRPQSKALQSLLVGIFAYLGLLLQMQKEVLSEDLWSQVDFHFDGMMRKEDFGDCLAFLKDYVRSGTTIKFTKEGEALFFFLSEIIRKIEETNKDKVDNEEIWKDGWKDWNLM
ncbi:MAG: hypothetical protein RBG13Loki_0503 [Promethearchaeota archaeon CR_4]|nr:MAG: hypothetical protein RBG13Loki_0503 [Candidatus Lokiarchaeota archaeon CR_4]